MGFPSKIKYHVCFFFVEILIIRSVRPMTHAHLEFGVGKAFLENSGFGVVKVFSDLEFGGGNSL